MSGTILVEARVAEKRWTAPDARPQLAKALATMELRGERRKIERLRRQFARQLAIINKDGGSESATVTRLIALALQRALDEQHAEGVGVYGALLALELGIEPTAAERAEVKAVADKVGARQRGGK